jgi:hypothetical protein
MVGSDGFCLASQLAARQQHPVPAGQAFDTNVRPQPDNFPFVSTTGVRLTQANDIIQP